MIISYLDKKTNQTQSITNVTSIRHISEGIVILFQEKITITDPSKVSITYREEAKILLNRDAAQIAVIPEKDPFFL